MCCNWHFFFFAVSRFLQKRKKIDPIYQIILFITAQLRLWKILSSHFHPQEQEGGPKQPGEFPWCEESSASSKKGEVNREWRHGGGTESLRGFRDGRGGDNTLSVENRKDRGTPVCEGRNEMGKMAKDKDRQLKSGNNYSSSKTTELHVTLVHVCCWGRHWVGFTFLELSNINLLSLNY